MNIEDKIARIENGSLPWEEWDHYNHLLLALYYLFVEKNEFAALTKTRCALIRYGVLIGHHDACRLRYNETMTMFWILEIQKFIARNPERTLSELDSLLLQSELMEKGFINRHYSAEILSSPQAMATYVSPDN